MKIELIGWIGKIRIKKQQAVRVSFRPISNPVQINSFKGGFGGGNLNELMETELV